MHIFWKNPKQLSLLGSENIDIIEARRNVEIAVLDDEAFNPKEALLAHKFRINELGPDIRSLDQLSNYPIIICDVNGVGLAFGSDLQGAHVVKEIRKAYPDKYVIAYTGLTYSLEMTNALASADKRIEKDANIETWINSLETAINETMHPRKRWIRMRKALLERGVELFDVFKLEQSFITAIQNKDPEILTKKAYTIKTNDEIKELIIAFSRIAVTQTLTQMVGA